MADVPGILIVDDNDTLQLQHPMKPSALRIERLLAKVEAELACSARPRR